MNLRALTTRQKIFVTTGILTTGMGLWLGLWFYAATQFGSTLDHWVSVGRAAGYDIAFDGRQLFGFPWTASYRFTNLRWANTDGIRFHADSIDISAEAWKWQDFSARFTGSAEIMAPLEHNGRSLVLGGAEGTAHVRIDAGGSWTVSDITLEKARFGRTPDYILTADKLKVSGERPSQIPSDHKATSLALSCEADAVVIPDNVTTAFGNKMPGLNIDLRVVGPMPDFRQKSSIGAWDRVGGMIEFDKILINWGSLNVSAKGTLDLDDDLQPEGAFSSTIGNHEELLKSLMKAGYIAAGQEDMLSSAMKLFAKPSSADGIDGIEVPIAVQLGGFFLGPVKILSFPQITWPDSLPANYPP